MFCQSHLGLSLKVREAVFVILQQGEMWTDVAAKGVVEREFFRWIKAVFHQEPDGIHARIESGVA